MINLPLYSYKIPISLMIFLALEYIFSDSSNATLNLFSLVFACIYFSIPLLSKSVLMFLVQQIIKLRFLKI